MSSAFWDTILTDDDGQVRKSARDPTPDNSHLVDQTPIPLAPSDYFHGAGQSWADPSIEHAAEQMRQGLHARKSNVDATARFAPAACGRAYERRLREIYTAANAC